MGPQAAWAAPPGLPGPSPLNIKLSDGSHVSAAANGLVTLTERSGKVRQLRLPVQSTIQTGLIPSVPGPEQVQHAIWQARMGSYKPGQVVVVFRSGYSAGQVMTALASHRAVTTGMTGDVQLATAFAALKARSLTPMFGRFSATRLGIATAAARTRLGTLAVDLNQAYVLGIGAHDPREAAQMLRTSRVVAYAAPNFYVSSMLAQQVPFPQGEAQRALAKAHSAAFTRTRAMSAGTNIAVPTNYAYTSSLASFLNANAVDWTPAYALLEQKYNQLPGQGEIITNVSIGDLTDGARNGDNGATTTVLAGARFIDAPSLPLIPTFVADSSGNLNPDATVSNSGDPDDGEVLLDFSVMAPLPHAQQRPGRQGDGLTDLLGIAPGAQYRLVLPQEPTYTNIGSALLAAAQQQPAPNVITASIGFGTDGTGFPGRFLEDDPVLQSIVASIVQKGIVVCIAANDGTRLYTNVAVGPDGGSTPTNLAPAGTTPTTVDDVQLSTTPSLDPDSGSIDAGGTTLDDTVAADPNNGGPLAGQTAFVETRLSGATNFSSGFGSRVNVSAPSDGIIALYPCYFCQSGDFQTNLDGGTSASAPEVAAAAAVVLQAARLSGKKLDPSAVRSLLASTGRTVPTPPQIDQTLNVGPQIDVGAAVQSVLGTAANVTPSIPRVGIAERETFGIGEFFEETDPTYLDLDGPYDLGIPLYTNTFNPITITPDWVGISSNAKYSLYVTGHPSEVVATTRWTRLLPSQILSAAGLSLASPTERTISLTYRASSGSHILRQATFELTFSASQGLTTSPPAPSAPAVVQAGNPVTVSYDLSHTKNVNAPEVIVSNIGHWSYATAPFYRIAYSQRLLSLKGSVTIPASAFVGGGGIYGITLVYNSALLLAGNIAPIRVKGTSDARPLAPTLLVGNGDTPGHLLELPRSAPQFTVQYDVSSVSGATGAMLEISAPGPTLFNVFNNFTNTFGTQRDNDGVDTPSLVYTPLAGTKGSMQFNAARLGLNSSVYYAVRVLPVSGSTVVGQASPVSTLHFEDTSAPGGQYVTAFDMSGTGSTVSTLDPSTFDSSLYGYTQSNETYGNTLFSDTSGLGFVQALGSDASLQQTIIADSVNGVPALYAIDQTTGATAGTPVIPPNSTVTEARVDGSRHRLAFLSRDKTGTVSVVPYDISAKTTGSALVLGNRTWSPASFPQYFEVDPSTGKFYTSSFQVRGGRCIQNSIASIDLSLGAASAPSPMGFCDRELISDGAGKQIFSLEGEPYSEFGVNTPLTTTVASINAQTLAYVDNQNIAGLGGFVAAADPVNGLLLVGYLGSANGISDNTGMGYIGVYNTATGALLEQIRAFNFGYVAGGYGTTDRAIQLDPATRTGFTYSADGTAVQQFSY